MARLRLFAQARVVAGRSSEVTSGATVGDVLDDAVARYGQNFADVVKISAIWLNGQPTERSEAIGDDDEVAVLPPVSGGAE